jgi:glycosyltransferase involved in cell wall biosynthesis
MNSDDKNGNTERPKVSVIIPTYNYAHFLADAIRSVLEQTFRDFELIIVDDGSIDDTAAVAQGYFSDTRVRYIYQENRGLSAARNTGIREARGEYIALLDADDVWLPLKLEKQIQLFEDAEDIVLVYCMVEHIDENSDKLSHFSWPHKIGATYKDLMYFPWVVGSGSSVLIRKSVFESTGLFDESLAAAEDSNMWIRILRYHKSAYVDDILVKIRKHLKSMSTDLKRQEKSVLLHVQRCIELFPELEDHRKEAYFEIFKGLMYLAYMYNKKISMLNFYIKAGLLRPSFFYESVVIFFRKYFLQDKRIH